MKNKEMVRISAKSTMDILDCINIKDCTDNEFKIQISIIENTATISDQTTMKNDFVRIKHQANKIL